MCEASLAAVIPPAKVTTGSNAAAAASMPWVESTLQILSRSTAADVPASGGEMDNCRSVAPPRSTPKTAGSGKTSSPSEVECSSALASAAALSHGTVSYRR